MLILLFLSLAALQVALYWLHATDLEELERKLLMLQSEAAAQINAVTEQLKKIGAETGKTLQKVTDLEALLNAGGNVSQEVADALAALKAQAQATDDLVPDDVTPPTP